MRVVATQRRNVNACNQLHAERNDLTEAVERVRSELQAEGFGVLCAIGVQATLKETLGIDREPHTILGVRRRLAVVVARGSGANGGP
jgi:uncharacterized protein (DUF302 family)